MKIQGLTAPSWSTSIALASSAFLLCTASAFADPPSRVHSSPHGDDRHHQNASYSDNLQYGTNPLSGVAQQARWIEVPGSIGYDDGKEDMRPPEHDIPYYTNLLAQTWPGMASGERPRRMRITKDGVTGYSKNKDEEYQKLLDTVGKFKRFEYYWRNQGIDPGAVDPDFYAKRTATIKFLNNYEAERDRRWRIEQDRKDHHSQSFHHDGMHKRRGNAHHEMSGSGHGRHHAKGHDGFGSTHPRPHQGATQFIQHILKFKEGMSLTAEQVQQLQTLRANDKKTRIKMKAEVQLASIDLHEVLKDEQADLSKIEAQFNTLHALKTKLYLASIKAKRDAKAVLSDEQRSRMDKIHERIKAHGGTMGHPSKMSGTGQGRYSKHTQDKDYDK